MKKYGKIPPHFLYYIENEGIQIVDPKSSNIILKDNYDRMIVKMPYSNRTLDIQIIFDFMNSSNPPDFIFVKDDNFLIKYNEIIRDWNFKDSSTLYSSLARLKHLYSEAQEKRLKEEIENLYQENIEFSHNDFKTDIQDIWKYINKIYLLIKTKMKKYTNINPNTFNDRNINNTFSQNSGNQVFKKMNSSTLQNNNDEFFNINEINSKELNKNRQQMNKSLNINSIINNHLNENALNDDSLNISGQEILPEISFSYSNSNMINDYTDYKNFITISYPLDIEIRSRNIPRFPFVNISVFINYDMKFKIDFIAPFFVNTSYFKYRADYFDLKNFEYSIENFENSVYEYFRDMNCRETIINRIINMNLGYTLEIDSSGFRKISQYIHCNEQSNIKKNIDFEFKKNQQPNKLLSKNTQGVVSSPYSKTLPFYFNLIVSYVFEKDDIKILNVNLIDSDKLTNIAQKKFSFANSSEKELDNLINNILEFVINNIQNKLNQ